MDRHIFLAWTTSSQWILFLAVILIIFSWIEQKKQIQQAGQILFFLLGIFSLWIILGEQIVVPDGLQGGETPVEARALTYFSGLVLTGILGLVAFLLGWRQSKWVKPVNIILVTTALVLFFMVYHLQKQS
jgi:predicted membrane channel-forming protein YqfA (hemolysin III family)